jgi:hypothetical protein
MFDLELKQLKRELDSIAAGAPPPPASASASAPGCGKRTPETSRRISESSVTPKNVPFECKGRRKWCAQGDDLRTFLCDFVACLPQVEFPPTLSL